MSSIMNVFALSAYMLMIGAPLAIAGDVSDELAEMRAQVEELKEQVVGDVHQRTPATPPLTGRSRRARCPGFR